MPILAILVKPILLLTAITALLGSSVILRQSFDPPDTAFATFTVLTEANGEVLVGSQDDFEQAEDGQSLLPGDTIRTGKDGSASILFFDGSTVEMKADTEISLKDLLPPQGDRGLSISFTQNFGSTLNRVVSLSSPADSYEVDTPSGVASVRGTVFWVTNTDSSTLVEVDEGVVVLQAGNGKEVQVRRGQSGMVIEGGDPFYVNADGDFVQTTTTTPPPPLPPANPIARQNAAPTSQVAGVVQTGGEENQQQGQQLPQGGVPQNDDEGLPPPPPPVIFNFSPQQPPPPGGPFDDGNNGHGNDPPTNLDPSNPGNGGPNGGGGGIGNGNGNGNGNGPN